MYDTSFVPIHDSGPQNGTELMKTVSHVAQLSHVKKNILLCTFRG